MRSVLDNVPSLAKVYGKWPSYFIVLLATVQGAAAIALVILLFGFLR